MDYIARQAPLSIHLFRQEYRSGLPFPSPGDLPNPGIKPRSPVLHTDSIPSEPSGKQASHYGSLTVVKNCCGGMRQSVRSTRPLEAWSKEPGLWESWGVLGKAAFLWASGSWSAVRLGGLCEAGALVCFPVWTSWIRCEAVLWKMQEKTDPRPPGAYNLIGKRTSYSHNK